ncbi:hypothetical protein RJT34_30767 [Clitoria ternatea]|uniref:Uncharacterized protein n=1 Tax=Clitoria ternatea TaxID=43366 RepID=A0AAN9ETR1_CLITE
MAGGTGLPSSMTCLKTASSNSKAMEDHHDRALISITGREIVALSQMFIALICYDRLLAFGERRTPRHPKSKQLLNWELIIQLSTLDLKANLLQWLSRPQIASTVKYTP